MVILERLIAHEFEKEMLSILVFMFLFLTLASQINFVTYLTFQNIKSWICSLRNPIFQVI